MTTQDPNEQRLIEQINTLLDASTANAVDRKALQQARGRALQIAAKKAAPLPWLAFALSAALTAVLVINLPGKAPIAGNPANAQNKTSANPVKPLSNNDTVTKSTAATTSAQELDLIENLELYEDAEFYQWLSEQSEQGAHDA